MHLMHIVFKNEIIVVYRFTRKEMATVNNHERKMQVPQM